MSAVGSASKENLIHSARELYMKYGVKSISMDDIAKKIGISKKTIYNLIPNKNGLVNAVVKAVIAEEEREIKKILKASTNALEEMVSIAKHVQKMLKSIKPTLMYDLRKYYPSAWLKIEEGHFPFIEKTISENILRGIQEGLYRKEINQNIAAKLYIALSNTLSDGSIFTQDEVQITDIYKEVILYHLHGITNNQGRKQLVNYLKMDTA